MNKFNPPKVKKTIGELAQLLGLRVQGDKSVVLECIAPLDKAGKNELSFLDNSKYASQLKTTQASAVILKESDLENLPQGCNALISNMPYADYAKALQIFYMHSEVCNKISEQAFVHPSAKLAKNVTVEAFAYIGEGVEIGEGTYISSGSHLGAFCKVGKKCRIYANVTLQCTEVGSDCIIHAGASIGQDGFGFAFDGKGVVKVPQIGCVFIGNDVEIGANTTIDRGSLNNTVIGDGTKIDNLVQIAHNVKIGRNCQIVSQVGIAGSTEVGDGCIVGGQAGFAGHIKIANGVQIAARAGVTKSVEKSGQVLGGFPAIPLNEWKRMQASLSRLVSKKGK